MENWMEKKWVSNGLWLLIGIPLLFATQLPMVALISGIENAWSNWTINSLVLGVTMLLVYLLWWFMKWSPLDPLDFSRISGREIGRNFLFFLLLLANNIVGATVLRNIGETTTANQETIQGLSSVAPQLAMGLLIVVVAPLGEEIICRAVIPRLIFKGYEKIGYLVGAVVFAYLHSPGNLGSWVIYGGMSLILTWVAYRYKRVEYSIILHFTMNAFAFLITVLVSFLPA